MQITVKNVHKSLNDNGYICNVPFAASITSAIKTKPVSGAFLHGPAGTGKSYLPIVLSQTLGIEMFFYQCAPGTREDDLLLKMFPSEDTKSGVEIKKSTVLKAAEASHKKTVMLVLDEWDKTRPTADGFFLDFLQYGRLSIPGTEINANLENMFIFFTANDERDFHEALLRRFPKIDVDPLAPSLVMSALKLTHDGHPHLGNAIKLYEKAVMSGMSKPATIQEIRQLLDAITFLGNGSDWNSLVYQYVTKTPENHQLLCDTKDVEYKQDKTDNTLAVNQFEGSITEDADVSNNICMPRVIKYHSKTVKDANDTMPDNSDVYGMFDNDDESYSYHAHLAYKNDKDATHANVVNEFQLIQDNLVRTKPYNLLELEELESSNAKLPSEIVVVDKNMTFYDLRHLPLWSHWIIRYYNKDEVIARYVRERDNVKKDNLAITVDMRWTKENGVTFIISTDNPNAITHFFSKKRVGRCFVSHHPHSVRHVPITLTNNLKAIKHVGLANIRDLVNDKNIMYSANLYNDRELLDEFRLVVKDALHVVHKGSKVSYIMQGCTISLREYDYEDDYLQCTIEIHSTPTKNTLKGLSRLGEHFRTQCGSGVPVYKAVKVNTRKASKYLKQSGWKVQGRYRTLMIKSYKSLLYYPVHAYLMDNLVVFSYRFVADNYDDKVMTKKFAQSVKIVNNLAKSLGEIE